MRRPVFDRGCRRLAVTRPRYRYRATATAPPCLDVRKSWRRRHKHVDLSLPLSPSDRHASAPALPRMDAPNAPNRAESVRTRRDDGCSRGNVACRMIALMSGTTPNLTSASATRGWPAARALDERFRPIAIAPDSLALLLPGRPRERGPASALTWTGSRRSPLQSREGSGGHRLVSCLQQR